MYVLAATPANASDCAACDLADRCDRTNENYACTIFGVTAGFSFHHAERRVRGEQRVETNKKQIIIYK